jgi:colicin import membrane protein
MPAASDRLDFAPPPQPAAAQAFLLAIVAHLLLLMALTWGINWKRESENVTAEAELWSSVPQQAAPKVVQAPPIPAPPPAPTPAPVPAPPPPPPPEPKVVTPPPPPAPAKQPDIALEREKKKQELAQRRQEELERQEKAEALKEREREKKLEARKKQEELKREQLAEQKAAQERKQKEEQAKAAKEKAREQADAKRLAALRQENLRRMQGLASASGDPSATGTAQRSSGPSNSYAGRIQARVRPNIVFTDDIAGNPTAEVEVRMAPDGTITSRRITKSSGVRSWDEAVLRALDRTEVLPRDVDGRVHTPLTIDFRPKS